MRTANRARPYANAFVAIVATLIVLDGAPVFFDFQERVKALIDPVMDATGLWQGSFRLFGPSVHKQNGYVVAEVTLRDGSRVEWRSPSFRGRALGEKFVQGRLPKLYDNLRRDRYAEAWRPFAEWILRRSAVSSAPEEISLSRVFVQVAPPRFDGTPDAPPRVQRHRFYRRVLSLTEGAAFTRSNGQ